MLTYADVCQVVLKDCVDAVLARKILEAQHQVTPKSLRSVKALSSLNRALIEPKWCLNRALS